MRAHRGGGERCQSGPGAAGLRSDAAAGRRLPWSTQGRPLARPPALCSPPLRRSRVAPSRRSVYRSRLPFTRAWTWSLTREPSDPRAYLTSHVRSASRCSVWRASRRRRRPRRPTRGHRRPPSSHPLLSQCHRSARRYLMLTKRV